MSNYKLICYFLKRNKKAFSVVLAIVISIVLIVIVLPQLGKKYQPVAVKSNSNTTTEVVTPTDKPLENQPAATGLFNYGEVLQKSIFFYECQRSGKLDPTKLRMNWRGDSGLQDGSDAGVDLTGGWYDAGDNVKFGLPMAYSASMLGWGVYEYKEAYEKSGQLSYMLDNIKWVTDYFIKCHTKSDEFYYQVGDGSLDHNWWGPAEVMQMKRPSYKIDSSKPGSAVAGETAASLAIASMLFKDKDPEYSKLCLKHAKELFDFADKTKSDVGYTAANDFYKSWSGFYDELSWAGAWLYLATNDNTYLTKAESYVSNWSTEPQSKDIGYKWSQCWDDVHCGAELLLARITDKQIYKDAMEMHLDYWSTGYKGQKINYSPGGLAVLDTWGSLRYATTTAYLAFVYSDWKKCDSTKAKTYADFAKSQVDYALGNNPRKGSFVVGFGENSPKYPHHRTAHGSWTDSQTNPDKERHIIYGALVGGPDKSDGYTDTISNYTNNEVACDYNAGFTGAVAKMYLLKGGSPKLNFKSIENKSDEMYVEAGINASGNNFTEIKAVLYNASAWPARVSDKLSFKYFMDLSEVTKSGHNVSELKTSTNFNQGGKISDIKQFKGDIYYVEIDFTGTKIYPGGQNVCKKEAQFRISGPEGSSFWNPSNDFSYQSLANGGVKKSANIPVYDNGVKVFGDEPGSTETTKTQDNQNDTQTKTENTTSDNTNKVNSESETKVMGNGKLKIQMFSGNVSSNMNSISPKFKLINEGNDVINLENLKLRYYYTLETPKDQNFFCDWSSAGNNNITGKFIKIDAKKGADYYLEIGFTKGAGLLEKGKDVEVQVRFSKADWSNFQQNDDYSFNNATAYSDCDKVTGYIGNALQWGKEP